MCLIFLLFILGLGEYSNLFHICSMMRAFCIYKKSNINDLFSGLSVAFGPRHGVVHHTLHGQHDHRGDPAQHGQQRPQRPGHQEQGGPREDQEEDQRAQESQREGEEGDAEGDGQKRQIAQKGGETKEKVIRKIFFFF